MKLWLFSKGLNGGLSIQNMELKCFLSDHQTPASYNQTSDKPAEQQTDTTGPSNPYSPGTTAAQVGESGTLTVPSEPAAPLMQRHTQRSSEEGDGISGSAALGLFKELFRTLNSSAFDWNHRNRPKRRNPIAIYPSVCFQNINKNE